MSKKIVWGVAAALSALGIAALVKAKKDAASGNAPVRLVPNSQAQTEAYKFDPTKFGYDPDRTLPNFQPPPDLVVYTADAAPPAESSAAQPGPPPLVVLVPDEESTPAPAAPAPAAQAPAPAPAIEFSTTPPSGVYEPSDGPVNFLPTPVYTPPAPEYYNPPADNSTSIEGLAGFLR